MSIATEPSQLALQVQKELIEVSKLFEAENRFQLPSPISIATENGRCYQVANALLHENVYKPLPSALFIRGYLHCEYCGDQPSSYYFRQFKHGDQVVNMSASLIHLFEKHLSSVSEKDISEAAAFFKS